MRARPGGAPPLVSRVAPVVLVVATAVLAGACSSGATVGSGPSSAGPPTTAEQVDGPGSSAEVAGKKVFKQDQPAIAVLVGEKFAIRLPEDPAAGEGWTVIGAPDGRIVSAEGDTFKAEAPAPGAPAPSAGQRELKYKAKAAGTTTITLQRCRGCTPGSAPGGAGTGGDRATFTVTVSR